MKIIAVHAYVVLTKTKLPFVWRRGLPGSDPVPQQTWLRLVTGEGIEGWSSARRGHNINLKALEKSAVAKL